MARLTENDYMYATARIRAMESALVGRDACARMAEASSLEELYAMFEEYGIPVRTRPSGDREIPDADATLEEYRRERAEEVLSMLPDRKLFDYLAYPTDVNNLKAAIKYSFTNRSPDECLADGGSVDAKAAVVAVTSGDFSLYPAHMAASAPAALDAYAQSGDPRQIDLILDCACYLDMAACVERDDYLAGLLRLRIDLTNLLTTVRVMRACDDDEVRRLLPQTLLPGGEVGEEFFLSEVEGGVSRLADKINYSAYDALLSSVDLKTATLGEIERACDNYYASAVAKSRFMPFGTPVVSAYLEALDVSVKNIRILVAGKTASLGGDVLRGRLRQNPCA